MESRLESMAVDLIQPNMPDAFQSSVASIQHSLQDGVESIKHTLQHGMTSVQDTLEEGVDGVQQCLTSLKDSLRDSLGSVQLPEVMEGVESWRHGLSSSWDRLAGSLTTQLHSVEEFVVCRLHSLQVSCVYWRAVCC